MDMATVYEQLYQNDNALTLFLLRLQEGGEPALLRVGAEGAAKLLFSGRLSEPKLFSNLLKFFFLPELAGSGFEGEKEEGDGDVMEDAFLGSTSRLQQILSVFFQSFFVGGRARDSIAFLCVSDLIADLSMLVRDGELDPCDVSKVSNDRCLVHFIEYLPFNYLFLFNYRCCFLDTNCATNDFFLSYRFLTIFWRSATTSNFKFLK